MFLHQNFDSLMTTVDSLTTVFKVFTDYRADPIVSTETLNVIHDVGLQKIAETIFQFVESLRIPATGLASTDNRCCAV